MSRKINQGIFIITTFIWLPLIYYFAFYHSPLIKGLGDTAKIIYFHVPAAWFAVVAFFVNAWYSLKIIRNLNSDIGTLMQYDAWAEAASKLGLVLSLLATITGSIWAKKIWHSYWNWDPRETSIFVLLIIYAAYFALRSSIPGDKDRLRLSGAYALFAFVTVPFFIFIIPRIYQSLHPDPLINEQGKIHLDATMRLIFFNSLAAFTVFYWYIMKMQAKILQLKYKIDEIRELRDE